MENIELSEMLSQLREELLKARGQSEGSDLRRNDLVDRYKGRIVHQTWATTVPPISGLKPVATNGPLRGPLLNRSVISGKHHAGEYLRIQNLVARLSSLRWLALSPDSCIFTVAPNDVNPETAP